MLCEINASALVTLFFHFMVSLSSTVDAFITRKQRGVKQYRRVTWNRIWYRTLTVMQKAFSLVNSRLLPFLFFLLTQQLSTFAQYKQTETKTLDSFKNANPIVEKVNSFAATPTFFAALRIIKDSADSDSLHEHIIAFGRDSEGNLIRSPISTGSKSSSIVPTVLNAFADLHTHPSGTPPSSGDLYGLLRQHRKDSRNDMRFVLLPDGSLYAFVVSDTAAAAAFYRKFPLQQVPGYSLLFPDALLNEYREMIYRDRIKEERAMAFILRKYNAGVSLLKWEGSGAFKLI